MLLVQNAKMKKSSVSGLTVVNWTLPAFLSNTGFKTCPNAGLCATGCYARTGTYRFSGSIAAHEKKLALSQSDEFIPEMIAEIDSWLRKKSVKSLKIRIHDAGDFYNVEYTSKWFNVMAHYLQDNRVSFYAYTKQIQLFQNFKRLRLIPNNFTTIFSYGGKQDSLINPITDRNSRVFDSLDALTSAGYIDGTLDDMVAAMGTSNRIGLVYHGAKSYVNTKWASVA
jgi:hypothetical protein